MGERQIAFDLSNFIPLSIKQIVGLSKIVDNGMISKSMAKLVLTEMIEDNIKRIYNCLTGLQSK